MMQGSDPATLALRDIHLPDTVLWWPPAPGWWILLLLIVSISIAIFFLIRHRRNHRISAMYLAKQELERIQNNFNNNQNKSILIKEVSELIRRVSISLFKRNESASLTGQDWLLFLDELNGDKSFSDGIGRVLIEAPYQSKPDYDETELLDLTSSWIDTAGRNNK
jgi:uncharacterized protein DUF4381